MNKIYFKMSILCLLVFCNSYLKSMFFDCLTKTAAVGTARVAPEPTNSSVEIERDLEITKKKSQLVECCLELQRIKNHQKFYDIQVENE